MSGEYLTENFTGVDDAYVSLYLKVNALPASNVRIVYFSNAGTTVGNLQLLTGGALRLRNDTTTLGADSAALTVGTVYRVGLRQKKGTGNNAILEAYLAVGDADCGTPFASTTSGTWTTQAVGVVWRTSRLLQYAKMLGKEAHACCPTRQGV